MMSLHLKLIGAFVILFPFCISAQLNSSSNTAQTLPERSAAQSKEAVFLTKAGRHALYVGFSDKVSFGDRELKEVLLASVPGMKALDSAFQLSVEKGIAISDEQLALMEREALRISKNSSSVRKLQNIVKVTIENPGNERLLALATKLLQLPEVAYCDLVSMDPVKPPADIAPPTPDYEPDQTYLNPNPGVNMLYPWSMGLNGAGIRVRDVEYGFNPNHEEFLNRPLSNGLAAGPAVPQAFIEHGVSVLGIVCAEKDAHGVSGMAYGAQEAVMFSEYPATGYDRVNAISTAINNSVAGDVILFEMQTDGQNTYSVPAEFNQTVWNLTKAATDAGIIIVAAAGNGNQNLDGSFYSAYMNRGNSGAIIVGAGSPDLNHDKLPISTYGSRVDLQGWGSHVMTCGYGDYSLIGNDVNQGYTFFSGTSSATPIVASCAVVLQSHYYNLHGTYMTGAQMRSLLIQTGIAQGSGGHIGPLPNMKAALVAITPYALPDFSVNNHPASCAGLGEQIVISDASSGAIFLGLGFRDRRHTGHSYRNRASPRFLFVCGIKNNFPDHRWICIHGADFVGHCCSGADAYSKQHGYLQRIIRNDYGKRCYYLYLVPGWAGYRYDPSEPVSHHDLRGNRQAELMPCNALFRAY